MTVDISAVLVVSEEGPRAGIALHSAIDAAAAARQQGLDVEVVVVLAHATPATRLAVGAAEEHGARVEHIGGVDPGTALNYAVSVATGTYVAMLDGGALWSENWLVEAHAVAQTSPAHTIVHPEVHWFYEQGRELYFPPDQTEPGFDPGAVRLGNCWDALAFAAASIYRAVPFAALGADAQPGDLDWAWSIATLDAGLQHRVAPQTLNFRRRRPRTLR